MFPRFVNFKENKSFLLLGARGTGKSTLLQQHFGQHKNILWIDLLLPSTERRFYENPEELVSGVQAQKPDVVIIDEIQKVPKLLNVVHYLIEKYHIPFILTGSSARKLKQDGSNLLAGRALFRQLFPLTTKELGSSFSLHDVLQTGSLPAVINASSFEEKKDFLETYVHLYLKEEIIFEQLIRKIDPFRSFLQVAAQANGKIVNFSNVAKDVKADVKTVQQYFQILEDTFLGFILEPYILSTRKRVTQAPKFYFFDLGVTRALSHQLDVPLQESTSVYGECFEHFFILEVYRCACYISLQFKFFYHHTYDDGCEGDLILKKPNGDVYVMEIKSSKRIKDEYLKNLLKMQKEPEFSNAQFLCVSQDDFEKEVQGIRCVPWQRALDILFP